MKEYKSVKANGTEVYYVIKGKGPALMLLHGFPLNSSIWDDIIEKLSQQYTIIVPDLPGAGKSDLPDDLSMEIMAKAMAEILNTEGVGKVVLCGHSMGGYVALAFAELYPDKVAGLGMIHSVANADTEEKKNEREKVIQIIANGGKEQFVSQMVTALFSESNATDTNLKNIKKTALTTSEKALTAFYKSMIKRPSRTSTLQEAGFPCLWIIGEDDKILKKDVALQQSSLAYVNYVYVLKNCGHMSMIEKPEILRAYIEKFLVYCYDKEIVRE